MKIIELRFKNLNSLYGEWVIDFTHPDYATHGIFALTGPTGAGKSTILDAICLALYGATPRLGRITKSNNEIMSRQVGECSAEVVFVSQAGEFRCQWAHRRARKSPDGNLQEPEHQIADAATGKLIETKKSRVLGVIEAKTGMDFDRFTRSMLLAQGGFDSFLKAGIEDKSKILEQITGTSIYSDISMKVHDEYRDVKEAYAVMKAQVQNTSLISSEELAGNQLSLMQDEQTLITLRAMNEQLKKGLELRKQHLEVQGDLTNFTERLSEHKSRENAFEQEAVVLKLAKQAALLEVEYATVIGLREKSRQLHQQQQALQLSLPAMKSNLAEQSTTSQGAQQAYQQAKMENETAQPRLQAVREADLKIEGQQQQLLDATTNLRKIQGQLHDVQRQHVELRKRSDNLNAQRSVSVAYLEAHQWDERLGGQVPILQNLLKQLRGQQVEVQRWDAWIHNQRQEIGKRSKALEVKANSHAQSLTELEKLAQTSTLLQQEKEAALEGKLLREWQAEQEACRKELLYLSRIASLETHRAALKDGEPCPLCGSAEHPFVNHDLPTSDSVETRQMAITQRIELIQQLDENLNDQSNQYHQQKEQTQKINSEMAVLTAKLEEFEASLSDGLNNRNQFNDQANQVEQELKRLLIENHLHQQPDNTVPWPPYEALLANGLERSQTWNAHRECVDKFQPDIDQVEKALTATKATLLGVESQEKEQASNVRNLEQNVSRLIAERRDKFGDLNPDHESARLSTQIRSTEEHLSKAVDELSRCQSEVTRIESQLESVYQQINDNTQALNVEEERWLESLSDKQFENEAAFLAARISIEAKNALEIRAEQLRNERTRLSSIIQDREDRIRQLEPVIVDLPDMETLSHQVSEGVTRESELQESVTRLKLVLRQHFEAEERLSALKSELEIQQQTLQKWEMLHRLIGSADGKKFRNFAQGLTFELMVAHANQQLSRMTDRYLLVNDAEMPLELNVIDGYQAGEIRSTKNLSGGESFIISLALALGLAKMSSRQVRVDSLFLDEGFGTLDEDALDTALDTLSSLHEEDKLIGIISHVEALKARIPTQIKVRPKQGGRSALSGPGCLSIS